MRSINLDDFHTLIFDFDGVFTDNFVYLDEDGNETVRCSKYDSYAINLLESARKLKWHNLDVLVVSTESNKIVTTRCEKLKLKCYTGIYLKEQFVNNYLKEKSKENLGISGVIYLGNDLNDLSIMRKAGFSISPSDAHEIVKKQSSLTLKSLGGSGFIREAVEFLLSLHTREAESINELVLNC